MTQKLQDKKVDVVGALFMQEREGHLDGNAHTIGGPSMAGAKEL